MNLPPLTYRKILYLALAVPSAIVWLPVAFMGVIVVIGLFGIAGIIGLRCIVLLPITNPKTRKIYNWLLSLGIIPMTALMLSFSSGEWVLTVSGITLLFVGVCLLWEINHQAL